ncbi:tyrosine-type recombinase/integrase [Devosia sp. LjRoot3]|uniref:tyrosine-type recombinase/integrase n=1 Tax=Devosia sp. LjRoot3 TaxID=3342319 RepID=UPI003ECEEF8A
MERAVVVNAPSKRTVKQVAESLSVFVDWCARNSKHWRDLSYDDVLAFQNDMMKGHGTGSGRALSPVTANLRATEATAFLEWAARHTLRPTFTVPRVESHHQFNTGTSVRPGMALSQTRKGRAKEARVASIAAISLLPPLQEIVEWLARVKLVRGVCKYLMAKFILETGTRRDETVNITVDMIPSMQQIDFLATRGGRVGFIRLTKTKGSVEREIAVALPFLRELRDWIDTKRLTMQLRWSRRTGLPASNLLFISDSRGHEGRPVSATTLYRVFKGVKPRPIKWHPHFGRHAYACFSVLHALQYEAKIMRSDLHGMGADWVYSRGSFHLKLLQIHMGHVNQKTTETYLIWLATAVGVQDLYVSWHESLSGESE